PYPEDCPEPPPAAGTSCDDPLMLCYYACPDAAPWPTQSTGWMRCENGSWCGGASDPSCRLLNAPPCPASLPATGGACDPRNDMNQACYYDCNDGGGRRRTTCDDGGWHLEPLPDRCRVFDAGAD